MRSLSAAAAAAMVPARPPPPVTPPLPPPKAVGWADRPLVAPNPPAADANAEDGVPFASHFVRVDHSAEPFFGKRLDWGKTSEAASLIE